MRPSTRHAVCFAAVAAAAAYLTLARTTREPARGPEWEVESVMMLDADGAKSVLRMETPFRILRDGRVSVSRPEEHPTLPLVRVDLRIDGEPVVVFARLRRPVDPASPAAPAAED